MREQERYIESHCALQEAGLEWIERRTNLRTNYPQMLCGPVEGRLLKMLVELTGASRVLEIGTFTGYSSACMALGLPEGGHIDTIEINGELEELILEGWARTGVSGLITLHSGDALELLKGLEGPYDFVFVDADKRQYQAYLDAVLPLVRKGGTIVVDDVLLGGKVYAEAPSQDAQTKSLTAFNDALRTDPRVESVMIPLRHGLSILRKL